MKCIIVDDEPLAREGMLLQLQDIPDVTVIGSFNGVKKARDFMKDNAVDLIFLDIQMPGITGLEFAATIPRETLVIFTTAYSQYALQSYEVEAIDYLVKPVNKERLVKAVQKAVVYKNLLSGQNASMESIEQEFMLIKAERRFHKILFKDILYVEGLKDYVVIYVEDSKIITAMNLKTIHSQINPAVFARVSKSYLVNINHIDSFDNHTIYIKNTEIPIGDVFCKDFLDLYLGKNLSGKL
ncbi:response regulator transcription factor [Flavobacterium zepuense]|uniref:Response regulator transcription factor n=1 Tax=Flavobacterium zepuense TaxID=2593302 RepID=A0A552V858_9FLAO|nr:LytTR family DNA-binding domain-containing protein [Flavobacterium zepuense]TRW26654.1 response regulator transcription factor [Flavobacterium zepuense]